MEIAPREDGQTMDIKYKPRHPDTLIKAKDSIPGN